MQQGFLLLHAPGQGDGQDCRGDDGAAVAVRSHRRKRRLQGSAGAPGGGGGGFEGEARQ